MMSPGTAYTSVLASGTVRHSAPAKPDRAASASFCTMPHTAAHTSAAPAAAYDSVCAMASYRRAEKLCDKKPFTSAVGRLTSRTGSSSPRPAHSRFASCCLPIKKAAACSAPELVSAKLRQIVRICIHLPTALPNSSTAATGANSVVFCTSKLPEANRYPTFCISAPATASAVKLSVVGSCARPRKPALSVVRLTSEHTASSTKFTSR